MTSPEAAVIDAAAQKAYNESKNRPFVPDTLRQPQDQRRRLREVRAAKPELPQRARAVRLDDGPCALPARHVRRAAALGRACARLRFGHAPRHALSRA